MTTIANDIAHARAEFIKKYGLTPGIMYLGNYEYAQLRKHVTAMDMVELGASLTGDLGGVQVAGMIVYPVGVPSHVGFGL